MAIDKLKNNKFFKALIVTKNVICWTLLVVLVLTVVVFLITRVSGSVPSFFGYSIYRVSSGSMEPELMVGDIILDKEIDNPQELEVGDIITFEGSGSLSGILITHQIIKAPYTDENGNIMLQTKGIANELPDEEISYDKVRAVMVCEIPILDIVYNVFLSAWGLIIFIILLVLIFIDEVVVIVRILTGNDISADDAENINEIIERLEKERLEKLNSDTAVKEISESVVTDSISGNCIENQTIDDTTDENSGSDESDN